MEEFQIRLIGYTKNPQSLSVAGALGCFKEKSSAELLKELIALPEDKRLEKEKRILKNSFGRGHGSVGDQNYFIFSLKNVPRLVTLQLCLPEYLAHLQQSLRRAIPSSGFYLSEELLNSDLKGKVEDVIFQSFKLYEKMLKAGIPKEDARFILPLFTKTNIQTAGDARELCHLWKMSQTEGVPLIVKKVVKEMIAQAKAVAPDLFEDYGFNYETFFWYPSSQIYALENLLIRELIKKEAKKGEVVLIDKALNLPITLEMVERAINKRDEAYLANLKHIHFEFLVLMSLACFHQAIRQRTWNHSGESIYEAVKDALVYKEKRMAIPPSIKNSDFYSAYQNQHHKMLLLYQELVENGISPSEAIGVIPHSLKIFTLIHINGWNAIRSIGQRTCLTAQWEIRNIAFEMARIIKQELPVLGQWLGPQCLILKKCPEIKDCGYYRQL